MITLKQGDCLELLKELPDNSVDMVLCDMPYNVTSAKWDNKLDLPFIFSQLNRIIKQNGVIALFATQPFATDVINANRKHFRYDIIWDKQAVAGFLNAKKMPLRSHEHILIFYQKLPNYIPQFDLKKPYKKKAGTPSNIYNGYNVIASTNNGERYPTSIWVQSGQAGEMNNGNRLHPTQKPVELLEKLIKTYTHENETVLDFTMGSGSTGVACVNTNRHFIGFELDEYYFNVAKNRIKPNEH